MRPLDKKLFRDLRHIWAQALAISLVLAAGAATLILAAGTYRSLVEIRASYYDRYRFADLFAEARRAPESLGVRIAEIPGVAMVDMRIVGSSLLDIPDLSEPATGQVISLPKSGKPLLNGLYLRAGRLPEPGHSNEIVINEPFAKANDFQPGDHLKALVNGRMRSLLIVGIALSPEFIYAVRPGELLPDDRRFGILWVTHDFAAGAFDMKGAFNSVSLRLRKDARPEEVMDRLDALLEPYGGRGAYLRKDQQSHAFLETELSGLQGMSLILPPVFLAVAAFLINMILSRLITMEREQIGLLKAMGYSSRAVAWHYVKLVLIIAVVGVLIGFGAGMWLGRGLTRIYTEFYHFPFLVFVNPPDIFLLAAVTGLAAAIVGALKAVRSVVTLPPAVAMAPPAPPSYRRSWGERLGLFRHVSQSTMMIVRGIFRWPLRAAMTVLGIAASLALLVASLAMIDSLDFMIDITYFRTLTYHTSVEFTGPKPLRITQEMARLPGVMRAEPHRAVAAVLRAGNRHKRMAITGIARDGRLRTLLDPDLKPLSLPRTGIVLAEKLAEILGVGKGDYVLVEMREGRRETFSLPVTGILQGYLGLSAYMDLDGLNALLRDGRVVTGMVLAVDDAQAAALHRKLKTLPAIAGMSPMKTSLHQFRETLAENLMIMRSVYVSLALIIAFGVVYNSARIQLSERGRELASLRVLGFTRAEVSVILLGELAILMIPAIPLGWGLGAALNWFVIQSLESDLFRVPFVITRERYVLAALIVIAAATVSALIVRRRIDSLDLVAVLKTRE